MNNKTLGQRLKDDSETAAADVTWTELKKYVQVNDTVSESSRDYRVTGKKFIENPDGSFHIQLETRDA